VVGKEASSQAGRWGLRLALRIALPKHSRRTWRLARLLGRMVRAGPVLPEALLDGLTRREVQVLRMVAGGNANKEIADQLLVSVATVERHLSNVYSKIGARGRTEASAFAFTGGLLTAGSA